MAASQIARDWIGIQAFPAATQQKLHELLRKLNQDNINSLTIVVMGKPGVGKSSTVNSLLGERVAQVSAFQSEAVRPMIFSRTTAGFTLTVIDTPGLVEAGYINEAALDFIKRTLLNKTIDVLMYVDRLDAYRVDSLDRLVVKVITDTFGKAIWRRGLVVLTHAQGSPPDGLDYEDFLARRTDGLLKMVRAGSGMKVKEFKGAAIPVALVENTGRCTLNENGEKVVPGGTPMIPNLVKLITEVISNGSDAITVDQQLIDGPNPNSKWKTLIPVIAALQWFLVVKPIQGAIKRDMASENKPLWELRDLGLANRKF